MADYTKREKTFTRHEYLLEVPSNGAELTKMLSGARKDAEEVMIIGDDTLHVEITDDEIVIWWQEEG